MSFSKSELYSNRGIYAYLLSFLIYRTKSFLFYCLRTEIRDNCPTYVPWLYSLIRGKHKNHSVLQLCNYNFTKRSQLWGFMNQQCSLAFWSLPGLFSTNVDLLGPQLFHFHQDYNVKTANICHCSDLPRCTRKTVNNFPPFFSQNKVFYPNLLQSTKSPLPVFILSCSLHFTKFLH